MWSRRAQEYEADHSGDPVSIAECGRRPAPPTPISRISLYSERQIYQAAPTRLVRELAAIDGSTSTQLSSVCTRS